jgi:hypothetical protein
MLGMVLDTIACSVQLEVISWAVKEGLSSEAVETLLSSVMARTWPSSVCHFLKEVLTPKPPLSDGTIEAFAVAIDRNAAQHSSDAKFSALIFTAITKYEQQLKPHVRLLQSALLRCNTPMTKALQIRVKKMSTS